MLTMSTSLRANEQLTSFWNATPQFVKNEPKTLERFGKHFTCFFCESKFENKYDLQQHQEVCEYRPDGLEFLRFMPSKEPCRSEKRAFLENFNLITTGKAEVLSRHQQDVVCDVIIVESSEDEDGEMEISSFPFNPENAGSQYSPRKLSTEVRPARMKRSVTASARSRAAKLLRIDVSSPLGLRLKHHICINNVRDFSASSVSNVDELEQYCKEIPIESCSLDISFRRSEDPRFRKPKVSPLFTVTYRQSRIFKYCHSYKFSRRQRADFCRTYDTGLNARSRNRLKHMKPLTVTLRKLPLDQLQIIDCSCCGTDNLESRCARSVCEYCRFRVSQFRNSHVLCDLDSGFHICNTFSVETTVDSPDIRINFRRIGFNSPKDWAIVARSSVSPASSASPDASPRISSPLDVRHFTESRCIAETGAVSSVKNNSSSTCSTDHSSELAAHSFATQCDVSPQPPTYSPSNFCQSTEFKTSGFSTKDGHRLLKLWSTSNQMPSLSFHCAVCDKKIETLEINSKSVIYSHYAAHGIFNISVVTATLPNGQIDLKLIEVPQNSAALHESMTVNTSNCSTDEHIVPKEALLSSCATTTVLAPSSLSAGSCHVKQLLGKRKHVKWADQEVMASKAVCVQSSMSTTEPLLSANVQLSACGLSWVAKPDRQIAHEASESVVHPLSSKVFPVDCQASNNPVVSLRSRNEQWANEVDSCESQPVRHVVAGQNNSSWLHQSTVYPNTAFSTHSKSKLHTSSMVHLDGVLERHNEHIVNSKSSSDVSLNNRMVAPPFTSTCPGEPSRDTFRSQAMLSSDANQSFWVSPTNAMPLVNSNQAAIPMASAASSSYVTDTIFRCMQALQQTLRASFQTSGQSQSSSQSSAQVPADGIICID